MVNVNHTDLQGDAHILISGKEVFMIDADYTAPAVEKLIPYLQALNISRISKAFVSHAHQDHYEGFSAMIGSGINIDDIYFNTPSMEIEDCCYNAKDFQNHLEYWEDSTVTTHTVVAGDQFELGDSKLSVIHAQTANLPNKKIDVNDQSCPTEIPAYQDLAQIVVSFVSLSLMQGLISVQLSLAHCLG